MGVQAIETLELADGMWKGDECVAFERELAQLRQPSYLLGNDLQSVAVHQQRLEMEELETLGRDGVQLHLREVELFFSL